MIRFGIDFGGTKIEAAALDSAGRFAARARTPTPSDYDSALEAVAQVLAEAERMAGARAPQLGVGAPGSPSPRDGRMRNANSTWLNGRAFAPDLALRLERPVRVANDANCLALSEATDGAGEGQAVVFAAILGTGCGAGLAVHGRLVEGRTGIAGEWGHNPLPWPTADEHHGPACWCGRHGCLETWVCGPALARDDGRGLTAEAVAGLAASGDARAHASLDRHLDRLARGLAAVCNLVDPDVIVLAGGLSNMGQLYARLPAAIAPHVFSDVFETPVRQARHGDSSGVRGAAWLWPAEPAR